MTDHEHNYDQKRRVDVIEVKTIEVYGDWIEVIEIWRYNCSECGASKDVQLSLNDPPHVRRR